MTLAQMIEQMKFLSLEEQLQLRQVLDRLLEPSAGGLRSSDGRPATTTPSTEVEFKQKLVSVGLLGEMDTSTVDLEGYRNYRPVSVKGQPVSETLVEERR